MRVWEAVQYILADHYVSDAEAARVLDAAMATRYDDGFDHTDDLERDRKALKTLAGALTDPNISLEAGAAQRIVNDLQQRGYRNLRVPAQRIVSIPQPHGVPNAVNGSPLTGADPDFARLRDVAKHPRQGDELVDISVNDLAVDFRHPALAAHQQDARSAYDWINRTRGPTPDLTQWHGTANAVLMTQGTPWLRVMAYKVMPSPDFEAMLASIQPAIDSGARVINLAAGMGLQGNAEVFAAIVRAHPRVLFVVAAGNDGHVFTRENAAALGALRSLPNLAVVGAATADGKVWPESNRGAPYVSIAATGEGVWVPFSFQQAVNGNPWTQANGTSFACPQVSNCAGKMMLLCPHLDASQVNMIMQKTVDVVTEWRGLNAAGGVLNPKRAMAVAAAASLVGEQGYSIERALSATGLSQDDCKRLSPLLQSVGASLGSAPAPAPVTAPPMPLPTYNARPFVPLNTLR